VNGIPLFDQGDAREALKKRCRQAKIPIKLLEDLVEAEIAQIGKERKRGLKDRFDELLDPNAAAESEGSDNVSSLNPTARLEGVRKRHFRLSGSYEE